MKNRNRIVTILVILAALLAAYFWWQHSVEKPVVQTEMPPPVVSAPPPPEAVTPAASADMPPPVLHPIEPAPAESAAALPALKDSDHELAQALTALVGKDNWRTLFFPELIVRHIVATVDNLPRSQAPVKVWPLHPVGSWMETTGSADSLSIAPSNAQRYARYVALVQAVDVKKLAAVYRQFYTLFQRAYVELGYPDGYFNDRLVVAIDDLLAAPEPAEPLQLVQKKVLYQYADPALESRSAGQKIMLRIGTENARIVKAKLRELRTAITRPGATP